MPRLPSGRISYVIWCCDCVEPIKSLLCPLAPLCLSEERETEREREREREKPLPFLDLHTCS